MKRIHFFCFLLFCCSFSLFGQQYEIGYYIDSEGKKTECYVRPNDLEKINSKSTLRIKKNIDSEPEKIALANLKEAGIAGSAKFMKFEVELDNTNNNDLGNTAQQAEYKAETVFLNVILEGKASLYSFDSGQGLKFFYNVDHSQPKQLIHKKYVKASFTGENNAFRQELMAKLRCSDDQPSKFLELQYTLNDMVSIFQSYNDCNNVETIYYKNEKKKTGRFTYGVFAGGYYSTMKISEVSPQPDDESKMTFGIGGEIGYLNAASKWEFIFRGELENVDASFTSTRGSSSTTISDEYSLQTLALDLTIGARFYLLPETRKGFFVDASTGLNIPFGKITSKTYEVEPESTNLLSSKDIQAMPSPYFTLGIGYGFHQNYAVALRYDTDRIPAHEGYFSAVLKYNRIGLNLYHRF
jgi:hypothetical protein